MFPDVTQAGTSCTFDGFCDDGDQGESGFVWLKARATGMTVEIGWERIAVTGLPGGKNDHTAHRIAVNDDLDVPTSEHLSSSRDRRYECTRIVASETLQVSC